LTIRFAKSSSLFQPQSRLHRSHQVCRAAARDVLEAHLKVHRNDHRCLAVDQLKTKK
jgi:hypothetical protein